MNSDKTAKPIFGTFGIYRWFLATMVLMQHLGPNNLWGLRAVYAFFMLSGYIVTYILDNRYLRLKNGIERFYLNRALRIYPTYWVVLIISIPFIVRFPNIGTQGMQMPISIGNWISNIIVLGLIRIDGARNFIIVPTAWSLAVEMTWWIFLPFIITKPSRVRNFAIAALAYQILMIMIGAHEPANIAIFSPLAAMMPFSLGTLLYFRKKHGFADLPGRIGGGLFIMLLLAFLLHLNFHFTLFVNALVIYYLSGIDSDHLPPRLVWIDRFLGNLAYPIFLIHIFCAGIAKMLFPALQGHSWPLFLDGFILSNILAIILYFGIEYPVNYLRRKVKSRG